MNNEWATTILMNLARGQADMYYSPTKAAKVALNTQAYMNTYQFWTVRNTVNDIARNVHAVQLNADGTKTVSAETYTVLVTVIGDSGLPKGHIAFREDAPMEHGDAVQLIWLEAYQR